MKNLKVCQITIAVIIPIYCGILYAQEPLSKATEAFSIDGEVLEGAAAARLPDLTIESINFTSLPQAGELVGPIKINIANLGSGDAKKCSLRLSCMVVECSKNNSECLDVGRLIFGIITVPPLKAGEKVVLEWKSLSPAKWSAGKYSLVAEMDRYNIIQESKEGNNVARNMVYVAPFTAVPSVKKASL